MVEDSDLEGVFFHAYGQEFLIGTLFYRILLSTIKDLSSNEHKFKLAFKNIS
jgi:hypothetical protein